MSNMPLVSIIMPTYNRASYLPASVGSVLAQTFSDWELIVWDDGSIDQTGKMVNSFNDIRIHYFYERNHGKSYALNKAINISRGEYIAILDDDDVWAHEKLSMQIAAMNAYPQIGILFGNFLNIDLLTQEKKLAFKQFSDVIKLLDVEQIDDGLFSIKKGMPEILAYSNFILPSTVLIRKLAFEGLGSFREQLRNSEDFELFWRMGLSGVCFGYSSEIYVTRNKHLGALSGYRISTYKNKIMSLDYCLQETLVKGRKDLIPYLKRAYRNAWQNLIPLYGRKGNWREMLYVFFQSSKYGVSLGSIRLLFEAIVAELLWKGQDPNEGNET